MTFKNISFFLGLFLTIYTVPSWAYLTGCFDSVDSSGNAYGWAQETTNESPITVNIYDESVSKVLLAAGQANKVSPLIGAHGFVISLPTSRIVDGKAHKITAYTSSGMALCGGAKNFFAPVTLQAASMRVRSGSGAVINGNYALWTNGYVQDDIYFPESTSYQFAVTGAGSPAQGVWPRVEVRIDGTAVGEGYLSSAGLTTIYIQGNVAAGVHHVALAFTNDSPGATEDRNLFLQSVKVRKADAPINLQPTYMSQKVGNTTLLNSNSTLAMWSNSSVSENIVFPGSGYYKFTANGVGTSGQYPLGSTIWPLVELQIDGHMVGVMTFNSSSPLAPTLQVGVLAGVHKVSLAFVNDSVSVNGDMNVFLTGVSVSAIGTPALTSTVPASYFGINFTRPTMDHWPTASFGSVRAWDVWMPILWFFVNPSPGVFTFGGIDTYVNTMKAHGVTDILDVLGSTPVWVSTSPDTPCYMDCAEPAGAAGIKYWDDYITAFAKYNKGRMKYWEIWNELQGSNWDMSEVVTMVQHAHDIVKSIDPSVQIVSPSSVYASGPAWFDRFLTAGGGKYIDIFAFHGYWDENGTHVLYAADAYKQILQAHGYGSKPIWDTESSWGNTAQLADPNAQAAYIAQNYLLQWSRGISRFYWYSYANPTFGGLEDNVTGALNAPGVAFQQVYSWMVGATMSMPCFVDQNGTWTCGFTKSGGYKALVVWNPEKNSVYYLPTADYIHYRDLAGNKGNIVSSKITAGNKPVIIENL